MLLLGPFPYLPHVTGQQLLPHRRLESSRRAQGSQQALGGLAQPGAWGTELSPSVLSCRSLGPDSFSSKHTKERTEESKCHWRARVLQKHLPLERFGARQYVTRRPQPRLLRPWPAGEE